MTTPPDPPDPPYAKLSEPPAKQADNPFQSPRPVLSADEPARDGSDWTWKASVPWIVVGTLGGLAMAFVLFVLVSAGYGEPAGAALVGALIVLPAVLTTVIALTVGLLRRGSPNWVRSFLYGWRALALTALVVVLIPVAVVIALFAVCLAAVSVPGA